MFYISSPRSFIFKMKTSILVGFVLGVIVVVKGKALYSTSTETEYVLETKVVGESNVDYCSRVFVQSADENEYNYFARIFYLYPGETTAQYVIRIDTIAKLYPNLDCWNNQNYIQITRFYYQIKYIRYSTESFREYFERLLYKKSSERFTLYEKRVKFLQEVFPNLSVWETFVFDRSSSTGCSYQERSVAVEEVDIVPEYVITKTYKTYTLETRSSYETEIDYCSRVFSKFSQESYYQYFTRIFTVYPGETTVEYVTRIDTIESLYPELSCWNNLDYIDVTGYYYELKYVRLTDETLNQYYLRTVTQQSFESFAVYQNRIKLMQVLLPSLKVWETFVFDRTSSSGCRYQPQKSVVIVTRDMVQDNSYVLGERYSYESESDFCSRVFVRQSSETNREYFIRIFTVYNGETTTQYISRIETIQRLYPNLNCWNNADYVDITDYYYQLKYNKYASESNKKYLVRILTKSSSEDFVIYQKRVKVIQTIFPSLKVWKTFKFDESSSSGCRYGTIATNSAVKKVAKISKSNESSGSDSGSSDSSDSSD